MKRPTVSPALGLLPLVAFLAPACDGDGGTGPLPLPRTVQVDDPAEDTFGGASGGSAVPPDILRVTITDEGGASRLAFDFAERVEASPASPRAAGGFVDLDVDRNPATGTSAATDEFRPVGSGATGLGVDVVLAILLLPDATVEVVEARTGVVRGTLTATYADRTITILLPHGLIGGDGDMNLAAVFGTLEEPTDIVPNAGHVVVRAVAGLDLAPAGPPVVPLGGRHPWRARWRRR